MINYIPGRKEIAISDVIRDHFPSLEPQIWILNNLPVMVLTQDNEPYLIIYNEFINIQPNKNKQ